MFDSFIDATSLRVQVEDIYEQLLALARELEVSQRSEAEQLQMLDLLEHQINEISGAGLKLGEDGELEGERKILANAEKLVALCNEAYKIIYDDEESILVHLSSVHKRFEELVLVDEKFNSYKEQLLNAWYALEDIAHFIRDYAQSVDVLPDRLRAVEDRLVEIDRLKRKYGNSIEKIMDVLRQVVEKRFRIENKEVRTQELIEKIKTKIDEYHAIANSLSQERHANSKKFEVLSLAELAQVSFEQAYFKVVFTEPLYGELDRLLEKWISTLRKGKAISHFGYEMMEFYFSANTGEDSRPIRDVASGGELSRLMLVLKTIIAPTQFPKTLIFDEIDSGIGGRVADAVGLRLSKLAQTNQVLCVTHQAQVARYADVHFLVTKEVNSNRTKTLVKLLNHTGRVDELARMLAGSEVTNTAKKHAREMLKVT